MSTHKYYLFNFVILFQSLIPLKEEWDMKSDEKKTSESYRLACDENKEIMEVSFVMKFYIYIYNYTLSS